MTKLQCLSDASGCPSTLQHVLAAAPACAPPRVVLLQVFGLSTATLRRRSSGEVAFLLRLIEDVLRREVAGLRASGVRLRFPGDRALLPAPMQSAMALCAPASLSPGPDPTFLRELLHYLEQLNKCLRACHSPEPSTHLLLPATMQSATALCGPREGCAPTVLRCCDNNLSFRQSDD